MDEVVDAKEFVDATEFVGKIPVEGNEERAVEGGFAVAVVIAVVVYVHVAVVADVVEVDAAD